MKHFLIILLLYNFGVARLLCGPGTTSLSFLKIPFISKPAAVGEAYTAIVEGADAIFVNPSRLFLPDKINANLTYTSWIENIYLFSASKVLQVVKGHFIGLGYVYLGMDHMKSYNDDGEEIPGQKHTASDLLFAVAYNTNLLKLPMGLTLKFIKETLADVSAQTFNIDFGLSYTFELVRYIRVKKTLERKVDKIDFSFALQNLGPAVRFRKEYFLQPISLKLGVGYKWKKFIFSTDLRIPIDNTPSVHLGVQWIPIEFISLMAGFKTTTLRGFGILSGFSTGLEVKTKNVSLIYAFVPYGDLGITHRFSFMIKI